MVITGPPSTPTSSDMDTFLSVDMNELLTDIFNNEEDDNNVATATDIIPNNSPTTTITATHPASQYSRSPIIPPSHDNKTTKEVGSHIYPHQPMNGYKSVYAQPSSNERKTGMADEKKIKIMQRNRESAARSYARKKAHIMGLELAVKRQKEENVRLSAKNMQEQQMLVSNDIRDEGPSENTVNQGKRLRRCVSYSF